MKSKREEIVSVYENLRQRFRTNRYDDIIKRYKNRQKVTFEELKDCSIWKKNIPRHSWRQCLDLGIQRGKEIERELDRLESFVKSYGKEEEYLNWTATSSGNEFLERCERLRSIPLTWVVISIFGR